VKLPSLSRKDTAMVYIKVLKTGPARQADPRPGRPEPGDRSGGGKNPLGS